MSKAHRPLKTRTQVFARHVTMARAALGMNIREFAEQTGVAPNTISNVENAGTALNDTTERIETFLLNFKGLELLRDDGKSIGVRLHYKKLGIPISSAPPMREFRKPKRSKKRLTQEEIDRNQREFEQGRIDSSYPLEQWQRDREREKDERRDKRVGKRSRVIEGAKTPAGNNAAKPDTAKKGAEPETVPAYVADRIFDNENPIRVWREHRQLTQDQLAARATIKKPYLSQIEAGKRSPSLAVLHGLAQALGVKLEHIAPDVAAHAENPIRVLRKLRKLSRDQLADTAGIEKSYLSQLETDKMWPPSSDILDSLAVALVVDVAELTSKLDAHRKILRLPSRSQRVRKHGSFGVPKWTRRRRDRAGRV